MRASSKTPRQSGDGRSREGPYGRAEQIRRAGGHQVSCPYYLEVRCERKNPLIPTRNRKRPTARMGAQGSQFQAGRSIMASEGLAGSYKTTTGILVLPEMRAPSQSLNWTRRSRAWNSIIEI